MKRLDPCVGIETWRSTGAHFVRAMTRQKRLCALRVMPDRSPMFPVSLTALRKPRRVSWHRAGYRMSAVRAHKKQNAPCSRRPCNLWSGCRREPPSYPSSAIVHKLPDTKFCGAQKTVNNAALGKIPKEWYPKIPPTLLLRIPADLFAGVCGRVLPAQLSTRIQDTASKKPPTLSLDVHKHLPDYMPPGSPRPPPLKRSNRSHFLNCRRNEREEHV